MDNSKSALELLEEYESTIDKLLSEVLPQELFYRDDLSSMEFSINPSKEEKASNILKKLKTLIEDCGGKLFLNKDAGGPHTIRLVRGGHLLLNVVDDYFYMTYILDCVEKKKLLNLNNYRVGESKFTSGIEVMDILAGNKSWGDAVRINESSGDEVSDFSEDEDGAKNSKQSSQKGKSGKSYNLEEDKKMLFHIIDTGKYGDVKGRALWMSMEDLEVCKGRTWQSMKERYIKQIIPKIDQFKLSPHCKSKVLRGFGIKVSYLPEEESDGDKKVSEDNGESKKDESGNNVCDKKEGNNKDEQNVSEIKENEDLKEESEKGRHGTNEKEEGSKILKNPSIIERTRESEMLDEEINTVDRSNVDNFTGNVKERVRRVNEDIEEVGKVKKHEKFHNQIDKMVSKDSGGLCEKEGSGELIKKNSKDTYKEESNKSRKDDGENICNENSEANLNEELKEINDDGRELSGEEKNQDMCKKGEGGGMEESEAQGNEFSNLSIEDKGNEDNLERNSMNDHFETNKVIVSSCNVKENVKDYFCNETQPFIIEGSEHDKAIEVEENKNLVSVDDGLNDEGSRQESSNYDSATDNELAPDKTFHSNLESEKNLNKCVQERVLEVKEVYTEPSPKIPILQSLKKQTKQLNAAVSESSEDHNSEAHRIQQAKANTSKSEECAANFDSSFVDDSVNESVSILEGNDDTTFFDEDESADDESSSDDAMTTSERILKKQPTHILETKRSNLYTLSDDVTMIQFIYRLGEQHHVKGNAVYKTMEKRKIIPGRTWQSLRERFIKRILPNLDTYEEDLSYTILDSFKLESAPKRRRTHANPKKYLVLEDKSILRFIADNRRYKEVKGKSMWISISKKFPHLTGTTRSWQSLKNRFFKNILPYLSHYRLCSEEKRRFKQLLKDNSSAKDVSSESSNKNSSTSSIEEVVASSSRSDLIASDLESASPKRKKRSTLNSTAASKRKKRYYQFSSDSDDDSATMPNNTLSEKRELDKKNPLNTSERKINSDGPSEEDHQEINKAKKKLFNSDGVFESTPYSNKLTKRCSVNVHNIIMNKLNKQVAVNNSSNDKQSKDPADSPQKQEMETECSDREKHSLNVSTSPPWLGSGRPERKCKIQSPNSKRNVNEENLNSSNPSPVSLKSSDVKKRSNKLTHKLRKRKIQ